MDFTVRVNINEIDSLLMNMIKSSDSRETTKAYMDCYDTITNYLHKKFEEQTGINPDDVSHMFDNLKLGPMEVDFEKLDISKVTTFDFSQLQLHEPQKFADILSEKEL